MRERPDGQAQIGRGTFFVRCNDWFQPRSLAPYPQVILDVTLDDTVVNIVAEGYDVAIRIGEVIDKDLIAIKLGPDLQQTAVASPDYLARRGTPAHPRDLLAHSCIGWRWPGQKTPYKWEFMENGKWFEVAVEGPVISSLKDFGVQAALDGVGIAFASQQLIAEHIAEGRLVPLLARWSAPFPGYYLCYPAQRRMAPPLRALIDTIRRMSYRPSAAIPAPRAARARPRPNC